MSTDLRKFLKVALNQGATFARYQDHIIMEGGDHDLLDQWPQQADKMTRLVAAVSAECVDSSIQRTLLRGKRIHLVADDTGARVAVAKLLKDATDNERAIAVDTETTVPIELRGPVPITINKTGTLAKKQPEDPADRHALDPRKGKIRLIQAYAGGDIYLFDLLTVHQDSVRPIFIGKHTLVLFNADFDLRFLITAGFKITAPINDAQLAMRLFDACVRWPMSMRDAASIVLDLDLPKAYGASDWSVPELSQDQIEYAGLDALITYDLWREQRAHFDELDGNAQAISDDTILPIVRMELAGLPVDRAAHEAFIDQWKRELDTADQVLRVVTNGALSKDSKPNDVRRYLEAVLDDDQFDAWPRTKNGDLAANKKVFATHGDGVPGLPELAIVGAWRKGLSTYGSKLLEKVSDDGRLHAQFLIAGAKTGRFSSRNPNLQNLPKRSMIFKKFRDIVRAPEGYLILSADYSQVELRQSAEISGDRTMRQAYREYGRHHRDKKARAPFDIHNVTASSLVANYNELLEDEKDAWRSKAKGCNFGLSYGSGAAGFRDYLKAGFGVDVTLDESYDLIERFKETYPDLAEWQRWQPRNAKDEGYAMTLGGRRWFWEWNAKDIDAITDADDMEDWRLESLLSGFHRNLALNLPVQGTCAEIMAVAIQYIDAVITGTGAELIATVHDEVVLLVPDDRETLRYVRRMVIQKMTRAWLEFNPDAPWRGVVEVTVGKTWGTALSEHDLRRYHRWLAA